ncbi:hypothetical protein KSD_58730 [Ktedonobacter sp. SOSP1-85]|nr:hypothetical protein KSD_58730 [Ktedonobacter sp. SOSP1-85]
MLYLHRTHTVLWHISMLCSIQDEKVGECNKHSPAMWREIKVRIWDAALHLALNDGRDIKGVG